MSGVKVFFRHTPEEFTEVSCFSILIFDIMSHSVQVNNAELRVVVERILINKDVPNGEIRQDDVGIVCLSD